jgi:acetylornithine deacetylase
VPSTTERVLQYLDDHAAEIVAELAELVRVPSVSGSDEENAIQHLLAARMAEIGMDVDAWPIPLEATLAEPEFPGVEVERREAWGVVGRLPGRDGGPSLLLNAHVDVVPTGEPATWAEAPFGGRVTGSTVHGRGACDMKAGLVAALWVARACAALRVPLAGALLLGTVIGEEDGGLGTYALLRRGWRADACIIPEPTSLDIAPGNCGALSFRILVPGRAAHASRRTSGVSAIEKFLPLFDALRRLEAKRNAVRHPLTTRWELPLAIEVGTVSAGEWASSVPDLLTAEGRMGVALDEEPAAARSALEEAVAAACADDPWLREHPARVQWWGGQFAPGLTDVDAEIVRVVRHAHAAVSPHPQAMWATPYGSDLRLMHGIGGVPTVHYGPGDVALAHGPAESVEIAEVLTAARVLALAVLDHCGQVGRGA